MSQLEQLSLSSCQIGDEGCSAIARAEHMQALERLGYYGNHIGPAGCFAMAESQSFPKLDSLSISSNPTGDDALAALVASTTLPMRIREVHYSIANVGSLRKIAQARGIENADRIKKKQLVRALWDASKEP